MPTNNQQWQPSEIAAVAPTGTFPFSLGGKVYSTSIYPLLTMSSLNTTLQLKSIQPSYMQAQ